MKTRPYTLVLKFALNELFDNRLAQRFKAHYLGFKLASSTFVLSILDIDLIAISHKHCAFNTPE